MNQTPLINKIIIWNPSRLKEIEEAKKIFQEHRTLGHHLVKSDGTPLDYFHPSHGRFVVVADKSNNISVMKILDGTGDTRVRWTKENGKQALKAKEQFLKLIEDGYTAFSVDTKSNKRNKITEFDVDAEEIIMIPPTAKG